VVAAVAEPAAQPKDSKAAFAERKQFNKEVKKAEQQVEKAEREVSELEAQLAEMEQQMASGVVNDDLLKRYSDTQQRLQQAMDAWEQAVEAADALKAGNA